MSVFGLSDAAWVRDLAPGEGKPSEISGCARPTRVAVGKDMVISAAWGKVVTFRLEICRDRRDRRSCKIFPSCVKFWGNNANSLGNYRVTYALNE